jgi:RND family efflux transporter MFP subunit
MYCSKKLNFAALGALVMVLAGCGGGEKHEAKKPENLPAVSATVVTAKEETVPDSYEATGTVKARVTSVLSARIMGYIREIRAQAGDNVKAGQVVAVIDAKEIETGLRQAEAARNEARGAMPEVTNAIAAAQAQLDLAESTYQRMKSLLDQKSITQQEFDEVAARRRMAQANLEMARAKRVQLEQKIRQADEAVAQAGLMKGYTEVLAPFAGTVIERKAEAGMLAAPGMPLLVVEQAGGYRLEAGVDESRIRSIRAGMAVQVQLETAEQPQDARVEEIVPMLDAGSRTFTVKIGLRGGLLRSGMFGRARFSAGEKKALTVPSFALVRQGQVEKVFVAESGTARGRLITTGQARGGAVEVLSGLKAGELVVSPVPATLQDGSRIEVRQ